LTDTSQDRRSLTVLAVYAWPEFWSMGEGRGAPSFFLSITSFPKHGHELHVLMPGSGERQHEEDYHGVHLHRFRTSVDFMPDVGRSKVVQHVRLFFSYLYWFARAVPAGLALARRVEPDAVFGMGALGTQAARFIARRRGIPNVTRLFGQSVGQVMGRPFKYPLRYREINAFRTPASYLIIHNDGSGGDEVARRLGVPDEKILFWPNGIDKSAYGLGRDGDVAVEPGGIAAELGIPPGRKVILTVSRLHREKHIERLIAAAPQVLAKRDDVVFVIVGEGECRAELEEQVRSLGVVGGVIFAGSYAREKMPHIYRSADLYVALSDRTNMGNPLDEAMITGLPVIALNTGRTGDVVRNDETGVLLEPTELPRLGSVILELLDDYDRLRRIGEAARADADRRLPTIEERQAMEVGVVERAVANEME